MKVINIYKIVVFLLAFYNYGLSKIPNQLDFETKVDQYYKVKKEDKLLVLNRLLSYAEKEGTERDLLKVLDLYIEFYQFQESRKLIYLIKALAITEHYDIPILKKKYTNLISESYTALGDFETSKIYALENNKLYLNEVSEASLLSLNNLGVISYCLKDYDEALRIFEKCNKLNASIKSPKVNNAYLINSAMIYSQLGEYNLSNSYLNQALKIIDGYKDREVFVNKELAKNNLSLKKYDKALAFANSALALSKDINGYSKIDLYQILSEIYLKKGNLNEYSKFSNLYYQNRLSEDSIKTKRMAELVNIDFLNQQKTLKINDLSQDLLKQKFNTRILILSSLVLIIITLLISYFFLKIKKQRNLIQIKTQEIENLNSNLEQKVNDRTEKLTTANHLLSKKNKEITEALFKGKSMERERVAAELHDNLGSTISAIKWRFSSIDVNSLTENDRKIYTSINEMLESAYGEVRNISHHFFPKELQENGLILALQKVIISLSDNLITQFEFSYKGDFSHLDNNINLEIYSIILELMTNIMKHSGAETAQISLVKNQNEILLEVKDDGVGIDSHALKTGRGIKNIETRLAHINGTMSIKESKSYPTIIKITIKLV